MSPTVSERQERPDRCSPATSATILTIWFYHGTCREHWDQPPKHASHLYLTRDRGVAEEYAQEWGEEGMEPLVVAFRLGDLVAAARSAGATFGPDPEQTPSP